MEQPKEKRPYLNSNDPKIPPKVSSKAPSSELQASAQAKENARLKEKIREPEVQKSDFHNFDKHKAE